jgi:hypothetical protein
LQCQGVDIAQENYEIARILMNFFIALCNFLFPTGEFRDGLFVDDYAKTTNMCDFLKSRHFILEGTSSSACKKRTMP